MKISFVSLSLALFGGTNAHYLFGRLILNGQWSETWEYIREVSPRQPDSTDIIELVYPQTDPTSLDLRCGRNASIPRSPIKTALVTAGDSIGFAAGEPALAEASRNMYHPGFASAWLSKSPSDALEAYTGDGDWFKILSVTGRTEQSVNFSDPVYAPYYNQISSLWGTFHAASWNFTIPATTPPGKYLLRFEHIFPNTEDAQFYVNCAQVEIQNPDSVVGVPAPLAKIPGVYERGQPDVYFSTYEYVLDHNYDISGFVPPAPVVWNG